MPQVSAREFEQLPLRVHTFLAGVPLHDVWAVDLPHPRAGITLDEFLRATSKCRSVLSPSTRMLLKVRFMIGRIFGWDREPSPMAWQSFAAQLTAADCAESLAPVGAPEGFFRVVYRFPNEQLLEIVNRTAHAAALSALVERENTYRFYFGVYVCNVGRFTPLYMTLIDPFRKWIVYPSLLRSVRAGWDEAFGRH